MFVPLSAGRRQTEDAWRQRACRAAQTAVWTASCRRAGQASAVTRPCASTPPPPSHSRPRRRRRNGRGRAGAPRARCRSPAPRPGDAGRSARDRPLRPRRAAPRCARRSSGAIEGHHQPVVELAEVRVLDELRAVVGRHEAADPAAGAAEAARPAKRAAATRRRLARGELPGARCRRASMSSPCGGQRSVGPAVGTGWPPRGPRRAMLEHIAAGAAMKPGRAGVAGGLDDDRQDRRRARPRWAGSGR